MLSPEVVEMTQTPIEIYSHYLDQISDNRFSNLIEQATPEEKEKWRKVELFVCIPVHATGDIESQITHTIENILLKNQTLDRSKIGIIVYANCAKNELDDQIKLANQQKCFGDLQSYSKSTNTNIFVLYEIREEPMTIGHIKKIPHDFVINLLKELEIESEKSLLCFDADPVRIPSKFLDKMLAGIQASFAHNKNPNQKTNTDINIQNTTASDHLVVARNLMFTPLSRKYTDSFQISHFLNFRSDFLKYHYPWEGALGFSSKHYCEMKGFKKDSYNAEGLDLIHFDDPLNKSGVVKVIDGAWIISDNRRFTQEQTSIQTFEDGVWDKQNWGEGKNGSEARNIIKFEIEDEEDIFVDKYKNAFIGYLYRYHLGFTGETLIDGLVDRLCSFLKNLETNSLEETIEYISTNWNINYNLPYLEWILDTFGESLDLENFRFENEGLKTDLKKMYNCESFATLISKIYRFRLRDKDTFSAILKLKDRLIEFEVEKEYNEYIEVLGKVEEIYKQIIINQHERLRNMQFAINPTRKYKIDRYKAMNKKLEFLKTLEQSIPQPKFRQIKIGNKSYRVRYYQKNKLNKIHLNNKPKAKRLD